MFSSAKVRCPKTLFINAQKGDAYANRLIGISFYTGEKGFPKDLIQAQKHYLRAFICQVQSSGTTLCENSLTQILRIKEELATQTAGSFAAARTSAKSSLRTKSKEELCIEAQVMLDAIEYEYGKLSAFETEVRAITPLKSLCTNYVKRNLALFGRSIQLLPTELKIDILGETASNTATLLEISN